MTAVRPDRSDKRLGHVRERHHVGTGEVRQGAGHPGDLVQPTGAEGARAEPRGEELLGVGRQCGPVRRRRARSPARSRAVATTRAATAADGSPGVSGEELVGVGPAERDDEIEAVQQRRRDTSPVAGPGDGRAAAGAFVDPLPARARVHRSDEEERRRERDRPAGPAHPDHPFLERLAQRLEGRHGELAQLVEEEHAVGRQAHLTGSERPAAPADEGDDGGLVVRRAERRVINQHAVGQGAACGGMDAGHRERLLQREWREQHRPRRSASMVLPDPGGPTMRRWCRPAAATSRARRPIA